LEKSPKIATKLIMKVAALVIACTFSLSVVLGQQYPRDTTCDRYYIVQNNSISLGDDGLAEETMDAAAAYAYYLPLFQTYSQMLMLYKRSGKDIGTIINRSGPSSDRSVPRPDLNTIYSFAYVDTGGSPATAFKVTVPNVPNVTYYSLSILDGYTEQLLPSLSNQEQSDESTNALERIYVYGSGYDSSQLPESSSLSYECPTKYCWIMHRFEITANSTEQIEQIEKWQSELRIEAYPGGNNTGLQPVTIPMLSQLIDANANIESFFSLVNILSVESPPGHLADEDLLNSFQSIGVGPGETFSLDAFGKDTQEEMKEIAPCFKKVLNEAVVGDPAGTGWTYSPPTGEYSNYLDRAYIALVGLGATIPAERIYASTGPLSGAHRMDFGQDDYPDAWQWSITAYNQAGYITPNPFNVYSVNSRSPNLNVSSQGGLSVIFQESVPEFEDGVNWIPTPKKNARYNLLFRITQGGANLLDRTYQIPGIVTF
jgi:hypothetical protein